MTTTLADPWAALGDPTRRRVLARVAERPRSVAEIADGLPVSRPAVSQHLAVLADAQLVAANRRGRRNIYRIRPDGFRRLRAELDRYWSDTLGNLKLLAEADDESDDGERHNGERNNGERNNEEAGHER